MNAELQADVLFSCDRAGKEKGVRPGLSRFERKRKGKFLFSYAVVGYCTIWDNYSLNYPLIDFSPPVRRRCLVASILSGLMMSERLLHIQLTYLRELYAQLPDDLDRSLHAARKDHTFHFKAFGQPCTITPEGILLSGELLTGGMGIIIALYARYASNDDVQLFPPKAFAQIKGSQPHQGAFRNRSEQSLVPHVNDIREFMDRIVQVFDGFENKDEGGDFSFTLFPLPKVPLYYVFYLADEEFPASVKCLFAANAESFMPVDGLADVGEHTAEIIIELINVWQRC